MPCFILPQNLSREAVWDIFLRDNEMWNVVEIGRVLRKLADLTLTFSDLGGWQMQFNVVSSETLREAQKRPEKHRDLVVKVAGYNAQFIMLDRRLQDQIIARTEYLPATSACG